MFVLLTFLFALEQWLTWVPEQCREELQRGDEPGHPPCLYGNGELIKCLALKRQL